MTTGFAYQDRFVTDNDGTDFRLLTKEYISTGLFEDREIIKVAQEGLTLLAEEAFRDASHLLRSSHLKQLADLNRRQPQ